MHYHAYEYRGPGEPATKAFDPTRTPGGAGFESATTPPEGASAWLLKPPRMIRGTWDDPTKPVEWLRERYAEIADSLMNPGLNTQAPGLETLADSALSNLVGGDDVVWARWLRGGSYACFAVICCPNRNGSAPCPVGRAAARSGV